MSVQDTEQLWGAETTKAVANFPVSGEPVPGSTRSIASGSRSSASSAMASGCAASSSAHSRSTGRSIEAYASSSSGCSRGQRRTALLQARARSVLPPRSMVAWRTRSRAAGLPRADSAGPLSGGNAIRAA